MLSSQVLILLQVTIKGGVSFLSSEKFIKNTPKYTKQFKWLRQKNLNFLKKKKKSAKPIPSKNTPFKHL